MYEDKKIDEYIAQFIDTMNCRVYTNSTKTILRLTWCLLIRSVSLL